MDESPTPIAEIPNEKCVAIAVNDVDVTCHDEPETWSNVDLSSASPNSTLEPCNKELSSSAPPELVQLSACSIGLEFTDDVSLLNAVPCWSDAETIQKWDLEWEQYQGDPEWLRRGESGELPEELVYRPTSAFHNPTVALPTPNTPLIIYVAPTPQEVLASDPLSIECPTKLSPSDRHHVEIMDAFRHLTMLKTDYQAANQAMAAQEAARHNIHTQLVDRSIHDLMNLLCQVPDASVPQ